MKVTIAVPGKFHYLNYIESLEQKNLLESFICSQKPFFNFKNTSPKHNIPLKEFLLQGHSKFLGIKFSDALFPLYHEIWCSQALRHLKRPDILQIPLHGAALRLVKKARAQGVVVLGEALNTHPRSRNALLENEDIKLFGKARMPQKKLGQRQEKEIELTDFILAPSSFVKQSYVNAGYPEERIFVLPYAGNQSKFLPKNSYIQKGSKIRILVVAGVTPRKGHHRLIEAVALSGLDVELEFAGSFDAPYCEILKTRWPLVKFKLLGKLDQAVLAKLMDEVDIFCLPTLEEGLAVSICEAMSAGLPIVTTFESGAAELIQHGETGLLYSSSDIDALAKKLNKLAFSEELRQKIGHAAAVQVKERSNWVQYADRLEEIYKTILTKNFR